MACCILTVCLTSLLLSLKLRVITYFCKICLSFIKLKVLIKYYMVLLDHFNTRVIVCCMTPDDVIRPA